MADETFKYPSTTSPTKTLTFATAGHLVEDSDIVKFNQLTDMTIGGMRMVKNLGDNLNQYEYTAVVPFSSESETDYADVLEFIGSSYVNGASNSFVWTDKDSAEKTVRMINNPFRAQKLGGSNYYICKFILEEVNT